MRNEKCANSILHKKKYINAKFVLCNNFNFTVDLNPYLGQSAFRTLMHANVTFGDLNSEPNKALKVIIWFSKNGFYY